MNKKDILGARPAAWNVKKMESIPRWMESRFCAKSEICFIVVKYMFLRYLRQLSRPCIYYFSGMFVVLILTVNWICKLIAFSCSISKWYQMLHRQHFVKYFYFTPIMLFSIFCVQSTNKPQYLVFDLVVQYRTIHNI